MRPSCLWCTAKHLGNAIVLLRESRTGYPHHRLLAMAELEQASQESEQEHPDLSVLLLAERHNMEAKWDYQPHLMEHLEAVYRALKVQAEVAEEEQTRSQEHGPRRRKR